MLLAIVAVDGRNSSSLGISGSPGLWDECPPPTLSYGLCDMRGDESLEYGLMGESVSSRSASDGHISSDTLSASSSSPSEGNDNYF